MANKDFFKQGNRMQYTCCICHNICHGYGNNPQPLVMKNGSRCCDECDRLVIATRLFLCDSIDSEEEREHFVKMPMRKKLAWMSSSR
ncbi:MAG: hypothetical protein NC548_50645 [Lachnospiraceae bacterium]|nr:hypothetical protein [Lachnospiraceae bacterium]